MQVMIVQAGDDGTARGVHDLLARPAYQARPDFLDRIGSGTDIQAGLTVYLRVRDQGHASTIALVSSCQTVQPAASRHTGCGIGAAAPGRARSAHTPAI